MTPERARFGRTGQPKEVRSVIVDLRTDTCRPNPAAYPAWNAELARGARADALVSMERRILRPSNLPPVP